MPPTPITATSSSAVNWTRESACNATASGCAIAAPSSVHASGTRWQIDAGERTYSASPPSTCRPSVRYSTQRFVRPPRHQGQCPHEMPAPETTRSPTLTLVTPSPRATTRPTNSCPRTTPGLQRSGPWSHSEASVPQIAARITSITTSSCPRASGSGTFSIRTSRAPWKTAAFTMSALDLDLDVAGRVARSIKRGRALSQRKRRCQQRRRIQTARRHEANRPRP